MNFLNKYSILLFILIIFSIEAKSQSVGISDDTSFVPNPSSILDLGVGNKGFLLPRVSLVAIDNPLPITSPATGLLVFNTNAALPEGVGFYYWNGTIWYKLLTEDAATGWKITGNPGTNPVDNYIGTTDNQGLSFRTQGIQRMFVSSDGSVSLANTLTIADKLTIQANGAEITGNAILTGDLTLNNRFNFGSLFSTSPSQSASISYILPLLQGATDSYLKNDGSGNLTWATISEANPSWELTGNAGTDTSVNFIGTLDATPLLFRTDSVVSMRLMTNGNLGLGRVPPDESALLELNCNKKGMLFTRLTTNERNGILNPAKYLTLYNIDNERFEINTGSAISPVWVPLIDSIVLNNIGWTLHGNTGTTSANNFIGTIDNSGFTIRTNNIERVKVTYDGFFEFLNPSSFYNSFITSVSQDTSLSYVFPLTAGAVNTYLKNDGSGNLSWATVGGGGDTYWALSGNELSPIDNNYHIATGGSTTGFLANAIGYQATASGSRSIALGSETVASAFATTALGHQTNASGERSTAMGENTTASGSRSTAIGSYTTAPSAFETVFGRYNTTYTPLSTTAWETADRLFVVGNGTSPSEFEKSDALIVYKNGNMDLFGNFSINNSTDFTNTFITPASQAVDISYNLPATQGAVNSYLKNDGSGNLSWGTIAGANPAWELTGNSGTNPATNFIGTSDAADLSIKTNNSERIRVASAGGVTIGSTLSTGNKLTVESNGAEITGNTAIKGNLSIFNTTNSNTFTTSASQSTNLAYTLPPTLGTGAGLLRNDGTGILSWEASTISAVPFGVITTGSNIAAAMTVSSGASILLNGTGIVESSKFKGTGTTTDAVDLATSETAGTLPVSKGGTNNTAQTANGVAIANTDATALTYTSAGATGQVLTGNTAAAPSWQTLNNLSWLTIGNSGTNPTTNYLGTSDAADLSLKTSNLERIRIAAAGNVNIKGNTKITGNLSISNNTDYSNTFVTSPSQAGNISYSLPATQGATNTYLKNDGSGNLNWATIGGANPAWELTGNSGTNPATNFIGTSDANALSIRTSNTERIRITATGNIGFNEATPSQPHTIKGNVLLEPNGATASQLRFAIPNDTTKYTAFQARTQKANAGQLVYTLPDSQAVAPLSVLGNDGTGNLSWTTMQNLAAYMHVPVYSVTSGYTITNNDYLVLIQQGQGTTYTIPQATTSNKGKILYILTDCSNYSGGNWTIVAAGGSLINCAASLSSSSQINGYMICSDGTQWHIINTRRFN